MDTANAKVTKCVAPRHIVLAASEDYIPGVRAFLNSYAYYHQSSSVTIHLLSHKLPRAFVDEMSARYNNLAVVDVDVTAFDHYGRSNPWATKIPRFAYAAELDGIVMLADADMFFCANVDMWFDIASIGYIIAGSNGNNFAFDGRWREKYQVPTLPDFFNYKTITSVPTVLDTAKHGDLWEAVHRHKVTIEVGGDFDLQNIYACILGKLGYIIPLPAQQVTGIHHFMLKPDTGVIRRHGKLVTRDGLEVLMVHGKWWMPSWYNNLMIAMKRYANGNGKTLQMAEASRNELFMEFNRWANQQQQADL